MKYLFIILFIISSCTSSFSQENNCILKGIELKGDVQVVKENADIKVYFSNTQTSNSFEVTLNQGVFKCGDWRIVEYTGNFSIQFVEYETHADIVIFIRENPFKDEFIKKYIPENLR